MAGLVAISWLAFGSETLIAYTSSWGVSAEIMDITQDDFYLRMATIYGQVRVHFGETAALVVTAIAVPILIALVVSSWRRFDGDTAASGAMMVATIPLASPYLFSYDLAFLILPILWLTADSLKRGFQPWDKLILLVLYVSPFATRALALPLQFNLMPIASAAMVWLIWKRGGDRRGPTAPTEY